MPSKSDKEGPPYNLGMAFVWGGSCLVGLAIIGGITGLLAEQPLPTGMVELLVLIAVAVPSAAILAATLCGPGLALSIFLLGYLVKRARPLWMLPIWGLVAGLTAIPASWVLGFAFGGGADLANFTIGVCAVAGIAANMGGNLIRSNL